MNEDDGWERVEGVALTNAADGSRPALRTVVKAKRSESFVHIRFECEDDYVVSTFKERDDPLYLEDVVEIFIDESGTGRSYMEIEVSPSNVVFDARVEWTEDGIRQLDVAWNAEGLRTAVVAVEGALIYEIDLPNKMFAKPPADGSVWRVNFYRIDQNRDGVRNYWAWSPPGAADFHRPASFGKFILG